MEQESKLLDRNPLSMALGFFLKKVRENQRGRITSAQVANAIGVGDSFYRMIEAGTANLHPSKALKLIKAFGDYNVSISWEAISRYLMAIQTLDSAISDEKNVSKPQKGLFRATIDELKNADANLEKLLHHFEAAFIHQEQGNLEDMKKMLSEDKCVNELYEYMCNVNYAKDIEIKMAENLHQLIYTVPSLHLDTISNLLKDFSQMPLGVVFSSLSNWEKKNAKVYKGLYGICKTHKYITSKENLSQYQYDYLWEDNFKECKFIFLDDNITSKFIHDEFATNLRENIILNKEAKFGIAVQKWQPIVSNNPELMSLLKLEDEYFDAMWIFILNNNHQVGFIARLSDSNIVIHGRNLNVKDTQIKFNNLIEYINKYE